MERSANVREAMERRENAGATDVLGEELPGGTDVDGFIPPYQAVPLDNI